MAFWDSMRKDVAEYVKKCQICQKEEKTRKMGLGDLVGRPDKMWSQVSIDHITKLPEVKGKDSTLVIQDQFSEMIYLKATSEQKKAEQIWQNCCETVWKLHGYPREIRTNQKTIFMLKK